MRPRLLDVMCGGGGSAMGYFIAGFDVVGVDIVPQAEFPFEFYLRNGLKLDPKRIRRNFHAVHASPPCKIHTPLKAVQQYDRQVVNLIPPMRELLQETGLYYVIENVKDAYPYMIDPVM